MGARYNDSQVGRFITRDTVLAQKPYQYCEHDPVNAVDPTGHVNAKLIASLIWDGGWGYVLSNVGELGGAALFAPTIIGEPIGAIVGGIWGFTVGTGFGEATWELYIEPIGDDPAGSAANGVRAIVAGLGNAIGDESGIIGVFRNAVRYAPLLAPM